MRVQHAVRPQLPAMLADPLRLLGTMGHDRVEVQIREAAHAALGSPGQEGLGARHFYRSEAQDDLV
ncbi:MAG TPA: hypothetical protein VKF14_21680 [Candidatus Dormibacteraeota bacterium]|nr:hypothetical protein [Candidatus Dormibacteraeota bacterium]